MKAFIYACNVVRLNAKTHFYLAILEKIIALVKYYILIYINKILFNRLSSLLQTHEYTEKTMMEITLIIVFSVVAPLVFGIINILFTHAISISQMEYGKHMRLSINKKISGLEMQCFDDPAEQDRIRQSIKDSEAVPALFRELLKFCSSIVSLIVAIIVILELNWQFACFIIISSIPSFFVNKRINETNYKMEKDNMRGNRFIEYIIGLYYNKAAIKEMKLYNYEEMLREKFTETCDEINTKKRSLMNRNVVRRLGIFAYNNGITIISSVYIGIKVIQLGLLIGDYSYYNSLAINLSDSVTALFSSIGSMQIYRVRVENFQRFMEDNTRFEDGELTIDPNENFRIEFRNVSFKYPNTNKSVFEHLSFIINSGEKIAFIGLNGSGKSTLIALLLRLYEPDEGAIFINGINIRDLNINSYRRLFSCMFQENVVYSFSLRENITISDIFKHDTDQNIRNLIDAWDIFGNLPQELDINFNKNFDANGVILSKGQAQSLQMIRTLYREAPIYIFDEPSAALDARSEDQIVSSINQRLQNKTVILISHRMSNIVKSDRIIVIDNGLLVESGNHDELMHIKGLYYHLFETQKQNYINTSTCMEYSL